MGKTLAIVSANTGGFETPVTHEKQILKDFDITEHVFTDENYPPRYNAMTPRMLARLIKMTTWQLLPDYDYYLWIDSSCRLARSDAVDWFIKQLDDADMAFLKHPHRKTVGEEADFLRERLALEKAGKKKKYLMPRYDGERLEQQMELVDSGNRLYATTAFIYKNDMPARDMLTVWWLHTSMFHMDEQLSVDHAIKHNNTHVNVINENYLKSTYIECKRK